MTVTRVEAQSAFRYGMSRVARHVYWARTQGVRRLIEEDELNPLTRLSASTRRAVWRSRHGIRAGEARPLFVVGLQRSGTNMLMRALARAPEVEVHNENDAAAFIRFRLRSDDAICRIVERSRHQFVVFKPLCDSSEVTRFLDELFTGRDGRAIWVFRNADDRARSAVAKFGDGNRESLRAIARGGRNDIWQSWGVSAETKAILNEFDYDTMSPESAAGLFWYVRNILVFELGLDQRPDVALLCYDDLVRDPAGELQPLCEWLGLRWRPDLVAGIAARDTVCAPAAFDPRIRALCDGLAQRLAEVRFSGVRDDAEAAS